MGTRFGTNISIQLTGRVVSSQALEVSNPEQSRFARVFVGQLLYSIVEPVVLRATNQARRMLIDGSIKTKVQ